MSGRAFLPFWPQVGLQSVGKAPNGNEKPMMNESTEPIGGDGDEPADDLLHGVLLIDPSIYGYPKAQVRYREEPHLIGTTLFRCEVKLGPGAKWRPFIFNSDPRSSSGRRGVFSSEDKMASFLDDVLTHLRTPRPAPTRWKVHASQVDATETDVDDVTETDVEAE